MADGNGSSLLTPLSRVLDDGDRLSSRDDQEAILLQVQVNIEHAALFERANISVSWEKRSY